MGETPFSLAYGVEAVIPLEVGLPTIRTVAFEIGLNDQTLSKDLDLVKKHRKAALTGYYQQLSRSYNRQVRHSDFSPVLQKVLENTKDPAYGKLGPNWKGPYRIVFQVGLGAYHLEIIESGTRLPNLEMLTT